MKKQMSILLALCIGTIGTTSPMRGRGQARRKTAKAAARKRAQAAKKQRAAKMKRARSARKRRQERAQAKLKKITEVPFYIKNNLNKSTDVTVYQGGPASEATAAVGDGKKIDSLKLNADEYKKIPTNIKLNQTYFIKATPQGEKAIAYYVRHGGLKSLPESKGIAFAIQERAQQVMVTMTALPKEKIVSPPAEKVKVWKAASIPSWAKEKTPTTSTPEKKPKEEKKAAAAQQRAQVAKQRREEQKKKTQARIEKVQQAVDKAKQALKVHADNPDELKKATDELAQTVSQMSTSEKQPEEDPEEEDDEEEEGEMTIQPAQPTPETEDPETMPEEEDDDEMTIQPAQQTPETGGPEPVPDEEKKAEAQKRAQAAKRAAAQKRAQAAKRAAAQQRAQAARRREEQKKKTQARIEKVQQAVDKAKQALKVHADNPDKLKEATDELAQAVSRNS